MRTFLEEWAVAQDVNLPVLLQNISNAAYIIACCFTILGIKRLNKPGSARQGLLFAALGSIIGVVTVLVDAEVFRGTYFSESVFHNAYFWIFIAVTVGSVIGAIWSRKVQMTGMPELVALLNGFGGLASAFVAFSEFRNNASFEYHNGLMEVFIETGDLMFMLSVSLAIFIGAMTFTGSILAWGKLSEKITGRAIVFKGQHVINALLLVAAVACIVVYLTPGVGDIYRLYAVIALSGIALIFGFTFVLPIGGGDMPVVISLLNSLTGIAVAMAGFMLSNMLLVISGALVGASGIVLTHIMCKAMNRSLGNLLFSGFGAKHTTSNKGDVAEPKSVSVEDAYMILEAAQSVVFVPGYGMAVAQAQHAVKELATKLEQNGAEVSHCVHPVAGRMPGHMNVLLAEADIPYEQLKTMDEMNSAMPQQDVAIIIGANDVVNPAAENDESSPIYGMPIIKAYEAKTVFVLKRGKGRGFSGIENDLFSMPNTLMIYGDAKATISALAGEFDT